MKKLIIIISTIAIIGLITAGIGFALGGRFENIKEIFINDRDYTLEDNYIISDETKVLNINTSSRDVHITKSITNESYISYYINDKKESLIIETNNDLMSKSFILKQQPLSFPWISIGFQSKTVNIVYICLNESIFDKINVNVFSGEITIENVDLTTSSLDLKASSGTITIKNGTFGDLSSTTTSGSLKVENVEVVNLFNAVIESGNMHLLGIKALDSSFKTRSGEIYLEDINLNTLNLETSSGSINFKNGVITSDISVEIDSGDFKVERISASSININISSGRVYLLENNIRKNQIKTSSGSVKIKDVKEKIGYQIKVSSGTIRVNGEKYKELNHDLVNGNYNVTYQITTGSGNVTVN